MHHYTDSAGFKSIGSQPTWHFLASEPPGSHPFGAYFTTLPPNTLHLVKRLRIPRSKIEYVFEFVGDPGLVPLRGGRGDFIFFSKADYPVEPPRHVFKGRTGS